MIEALGEATSIASVNLIYSTGDPQPRMAERPAFVNLSVLSIS